MIIIFIIATGPPVHPVVTIITTPYSANITWIVPFITFDRETYMLEYGSDMNMPDASVIMGNTDLFTINQTFFVTLTDLSPFTEYYYILNATNSNATTTTGRNTFTTDETGMLYIIMCVHRYVSR